MDMFGTPGKGALTTLSEGITPLERDGGTVGATQQGEPAHHIPRTIGELDRLVAALSPYHRSLFARLFHVITEVGHLTAPQPMQEWVRRQFGSLDAVEHQKIVRVINAVTGDDVLFNALRSQRPIQMNNGFHLDETVEPSPDDPLRAPLESTPEDPFGRIRGRFGITAANVAKIDAHSSLVIFDEYNPLRFTADQISDYFSLGWEWASKAHHHDPAAVYYFFMWNCLWRSGASLLHGHAQMMLARGRHYAKVERLRRDALSYRHETGANYFEDLYTVHEALGLAFQKNGVRILTPLTPVKEKETLVIADPFDPTLPERVYEVLACLRDRMGVTSFNMALYQGPVGPAPEDWSGFPNIVRIVDRGGLNGRTSDIGGMELYAASVVASDPFAVAAILRQA